MKAEGKSVFAPHGSGSRNPRAAGQIPTAPSTCDTKPHPSYGTECSDWGGAGCKCAPQCCSVTPRPHEQVDTDAYGDAASSGMFSFQTHESDMFYAR